MGNFLKKILFIKKCKFVDLGFKVELVVDGVVAMTHIKYETISGISVIDRVDVTRDKDGSLTKADLYSVYESSKICGVRALLRETKINRERYI